MTLEQIDFEQIEQDLQKILKPSRYRHTIGVAQTAVKLARIYHVDVTKARLAGLLHDSAKSMSDADKIKMCRKYDVEVTEAESKNLSLLHAKCGALRAKYEYGIEDPDILHAIWVHTTGVPHMNLLDKILFIADYIEPNRDQAPHLPQLRQMAEKDLDRTVYQILADTVAYLNTRKDQVMDPTTCRAYEYYKKLEKGES